MLTHHPISASRIPEMGDTAELLGFTGIYCDEPELASVVRNSARQMFAGLLPGKE